ncbi:MAG: RNA repair domain-containing protein [Candidatus Bathyarchaeota archaeon]
MFNLRDVLNRIRWNKKFNPDDYVITFIHRDAKSNRKTIPYRVITTIGKSWFTYKNSETDEETFIPYHRILEIRNVKTGKILWSKVLKLKNS